MALALTGVYAQNNLPALAGKVIELILRLKKLWAVKFIIDIVFI